MTNLELIAEAADLITKLADVDPQGVERGRGYFNDGLIAVRADDWDTATVHFNRVIQLLNR